MRLCDPAVNVVIARVAAPVLRGTVPSTVLSSEKTTDPVGVPAADDTAAVSVTEPCNATGFGAAERLIAGVTFATVYESAAEVLAVKFVSPANEAVRVSVPVGSEVTFRIATPLERGAVPRDVAPL